MRDYISSDDAATIMVKSLRLVDNNKNYIKKIVASERPTTIAEIIGIFKRLHPYAPPRIIKQTVGSTSAYGRALRYKSNQNYKCINFKLTSLEIGISRIIAHELVVYIQRDAKNIIS
jgi:UDP-glucose 4-epimerase